MLWCPECNRSDTIVAEANTSVIEESNIVSEVTFIEGSNGTSSVSGQYVSEEGRGKSYRGRGVPGLTREAREVTIEKGRKRIQTLATSLKLANRYVEAAQRLYSLALQHNFVQDFSDVLQINVFVLGHTFLRFCHILNLQPPLIDPSLYIQRFAARLEFEDKTQAVANTAIRLVQRMKRDWIVTGRRPAGICGASLIIAARLHGFKRTVKEIVQVVRICDITIRKRLSEFEETKSSTLTAEEFDTIDLEEECDPPAFTRGRKIAKQKQTKQVVEKDEEEEKEDDHEEEPLLRSKRKAPSTPDPINDNVDDILQVNAIPAEEIEKEVEDTLSSEAFQEMEAAQSQPVPIRTHTHTSSFTAASFQLPPPPSEGTSITPAVIPLESIGDDLSDEDDPELDSYLATKEEIEFRTQIWTTMNKDYIRMMEEKAEKLKQEEAAGKNAKPRKKRKKSEPKKPIGPAETAAEATMEMLKRRTSTKINYTALEDLFSINQKILKTGEREGSDSELHTPGKHGKSDEEEEEEEDDEETRVHKATYSSEPDSAYSDYD